MNINNMVKRVSNSLFQSGVIFIHGRDTKFRPVIIIDFNRLAFKEHIIDEYIELTIALIEFVINYMMVPGKVEQLIVFCDMANTWFDDV